MPRPLTESELKTISNALTIAVNRLMDHANNLKYGGEQFQRQAKESRELKTLLQNADRVYIEVGGFQEDEDDAGN